jgi:hypothetical protein
MTTGRRFALLVAVSWAAAVTLVSARSGAGRAFPIAAENFVCDSFEKINPSIEWDPTNFLVDLSGHYANCKALRKPMGLVTVDRLTPDGAPITAVVGSIEGSGTDVIATTAYIEELLKRWLSARTYNSYIIDATRFGCSVRPGCDGQVVVACLFAPQGGNIQKDRTAPAKLEQRTTITTARPTTTTPVPTTTVTDEPLPGFQRALAFTPQQYDVAAQVIGKSWDQSHYLENLSGFETDCSMIGTTSWPFEHTNRFNRRQGLNIKGQYGYSLNKGSTPNALNEILDNQKFKNTVSVSAKDLGCSLIPDCIHNQQMYVVISCLYEE